MDLHIIDVPGHHETHIIYRPLLRLAFAGNRALADVVRRYAANPTQHPPPGSTADFLEAVGFLQPDPPPPFEPGAELQPTNAVLLLTNQCQLRCTYCYAAAGSQPAAYLTEAQGYAAIDTVCRCAQDRGAERFGLSLHGGGEPTLAWSVLKACVAYARRQPLPAVIDLTSNGIWSPTQRDWIMANIDRLTISVDGTPATQNAQRPMVSGSGSAELVMANIATLDAHNVPYGIRMTVTPPWERLPTDVSHLCESTRCRIIQAEPVFWRDDAVGTDMKLIPDGLENEASFAEAFLTAYRVAAAAGRHFYFAGARLGAVTATFCSAPFDALVVTPQGNLVTCYEVTAPNHPLAACSTIGTTHSGAVIIDEAARTRLHARMAERRMGCRACFCYYSCAGDCYARTWQAGADGHLHYGVRCQLNRTVMRSLLLDAIAAGEGVWRGELNGFPAVATPGGDERA